MSPDRELWNDDPGALRPARRGLYIAVSGNTGAGKSSLIRAVVELAASRGSKVMGVSERSFHHPLLRLMFGDPGRYAFANQLNFMLQRHLLLLRQLELGNTLVIERSHLDDELFVREHVAAGHIAEDQLAAYQELARALHARVPAPDLLLLVHVSPELSLARVKQSEDRNERPREFPDEASKARWVHRWYDLYQALHQDLRQRFASPSPSHPALLEVDATRTTASIASQVVDFIAAARERQVQPSKEEALSIGD
jgi:deoxyadenosine/deoxycytidine kinase